MALTSTATITTVSVAPETPTDYGDAVTYPSETLSAAVTIS